MLVNLKNLVSIIMEHVLLIASKTPNIILLFQGENCYTLFTKDIKRGLFVGMPKPSFFSY